MDRKVWNEVIITLFDFPSFFVVNIVKFLMSSYNRGYRMMKQLVKLKTGILVTLMIPLAKLKSVILMMMIMIPLVKLKTIILMMMMSLKMFVQFVITAAVFCGSSIICLSLIFVTW